MPAAVLFPSAQTFIQYPNRSLYSTFSAVHIRRAICTPSAVHWLKNSTFSISLYTLNCTWSRAGQLNSTLTATLESDRSDLRSTLKHSSPTKELVTLCTTKQNTFDTKEKKNASPDDGRLSLTLAWLRACSRIGNEMWKNTQ